MGGNHTRSLNSKGAHPMWPRSDDEKRRVNKRANGKRSFWPVWWKSLVISDKAIYDLHRNIQGEVAVQVSLKGIRLRWKSEEGDRVRARGDETWHENRSCNLAGPTEAINRRASVLARPLSRWQVDMFILLLQDWCGISNDYTSPQIHARTHKHTSVSFFLLGS